MINYSLKYILSSKLIRGKFECFFEHFVHMKFSPIVYFNLLILKIKVIEDLICFNIAKSTMINFEILHNICIEKL